MNVLIVEDELPDMEHHRHVVATSIANAVITEASTRDEAVKYARDNNFDLAIVDLSLHGDVDAGGAVISQLQRSNAAIIVISGLDVGTFRPLMFKHSIWDYFPKPIDSASLRLVVQRVRERREISPQQELSAKVPHLEWPDPLTDPRWKGRLVTGFSVSERRILQELLRTPNKPVSKSTLFDTSDHWDRDPDRLRHALAQMISEIRKAFREHDPKFQSIVAVGSAGYIWSVQE